MYVCPRCHQQLTRTQGEKGVVYCCQQCGGRAVAVAVLRQIVPRDEVKQLWLLAREHAAKPGVDCPICGRSMAEVPLAVGDSEVHLDVCAKCQYVWFDPNEMDQLPVLASAPSDRERIPEQLREQIAIAQIERVAEQARGDEFSSEEPDEAWKWIPGVLGMPVEQDAGSMTLRPWITWGLAAAVVLVFLLTLGDIHSVATDFGLVPARLWRYGGLTLVTGFFLHAGLFHLIGNTYFLLIFGDNVEDALGRWRYAALLAAASIVADMAHVVGDPQSAIPCIGASGGISGVLVFYALKFPRARLGFLVGRYMVYRWFFVPAGFVLVGWLLLQFYMAHLQLSGLSNVSALAHLGGAAVGLVAWLLWKDRSTE